MRPPIFRWVRVGDGGLEPAAIAWRDGRRLAFTIGCPDGFALGKGSAVKLGELIEPPFEMMTEEEQEREDELARRRERRYRKLHPDHGYAGFGRRQ